MEFALVIEFVMPGMLSGLYQIGVGVLGPGLLLLLLIISALPVRRKRK
jgi:hypothetical protein